MSRVFVLSLVLCMAIALPAPTQEADVSKSINLGPLADSFTLISATAAQGGPTEIGILLKLRAKKDVDTSDLNFQVGFFDKGKVVIKAAPLKFEANFPLQTGEMVYASCIFGNVEFEEGNYPWHTIVIRQGKKPN
jgi:hypothetical protein